MSEDGSFYYVMELLSGFDLETLIRRHGPVPAERAIHILRQVCRSLGEAHRKGLVHRDIKPSNIYLCERAFEPDFVKVLDFGLVKRSSPVEGQPDLTELKTLPGTPAFLAPELVRNEGGTIDGRADFYSLGCVAFWLLTGKFVFDEPTVLAMILAHVNAQPPAPSLSSEVTIPRELDRLVLDCLAKRPADRPASAEEIVRKLDGVPLEALWTSDRAAEWWSMHHPVFESSTPASTHAARPR